jgi:branched-subunit amino acid transport protein
MDATRLEIILIMGLMAFAVRALPQILFVGRQFPEAWDRFLRYLSYALICSIIAVTLFMSNNRFETQASPRRAVALAVAIAVAHFTKSAVTGMLIGTVVILGLSWLG